MEDDKPSYFGKWTTLKPDVKILPRYEHLFCCDKYLEDMTAEDYATCQKEWLDDLITRVGAAIKEAEKVINETHRGRRDENEQQGKGSSVEQAD